MATVSQDYSHKNKSTAAITPEASTYTNFHITMLLAVIDGEKL